MKTPIEELIKRFEKFPLNEATKDHVISLAEQLLEKEKQAIIEAYKGGEMLMGKSIRAEQYYKQKYNK